MISDKYFIAFSLINVSSVSSRFFIIIPYSFRYVNIGWKSYLTKEARELWDEGLKYTDEEIHDEISKQRDCDYIVIEDDDFSYYGQVENDLAHGKGKLVYNTGAIYEGEFFDGKYHGHGKLTLPDGTRREGMFLMGRFYK